MVSGTFAEKLDHLFRTVHPAGRGPYTLQEASEAIGAGAGEGRAGLSASAIQKLRIGTKTNPTMRTIESLARVFGVAPQYFFDDAPPAGPADPGLLAAVDVPGVRALALDAAALSQESRAAVHAMAVRLRELEAGAVTPRRGSGRSR
ncbi:helix-turn-helix domain-containing protein [Kitasatospora sp. NBC_00315]|uniref:helix-turn-helix domain-containing protein n=1 Tax=Kitasatospora sp. NBC_00315 TaxID=2975963 RepID=UPI003248D2EC